MNDMLKHAQGKVTLMEERIEELEKLLVRSARVIEIYCGYAEREAFRVWQDIVDAVPEAFPEEEEDDAS